jgi:hypothetical protein
MLVSTPITAASLSRVSSYRLIDVFQGGATLRVGEYISQCRYITGCGGKPYRSVGFDLEPQSVADF